MPTVKPPLYILEDPGIARMDAEISPPAAVSPTDTVSFRDARRLATSPARARRLAGRNTPCSVEVIVCGGCTTFI